MLKTLVLSIAVFISITSFALADNVAGNAVLFDGNDDYICIPDASHFGGMSAMTMELWYCPFDTLESSLIIKGDGIHWNTDRSFELYLHQEYLPTVYAGQFFSGSSGWTMVNSDAPSVILNQWIHLAATYDSINSVSKLYLNGNLLTTTYFLSDGITPISETIRDSQIALTFGGRTGSWPAGYAYGMMDEVRLWNVARSDAEIKEWYNKILNPNANGLLGYWNFDEDLSNQTIIDLSAFGTNGTLGSSSGVEACDPSRVVSTAPIIPEPASLLLLGLGGLLLRKR